MEAGTIVLRVFQHLENHPPPAAGWDLDALILKVQGQNPVALHPVVRDFIHDRLEGEIGNLPLDQTVALLRANPGCRLHTPAGVWDLTHLEPPPVCRAVLCRGEQRLGSFELTDDLGREADELRELLPGQDWQVTEEFIWRLDRQFFQVAHPSKLRSQARPVLGGTPTPSLWVLTLPEDEFPGNAEMVERAPTRFLLRAWPTLDRELLPGFRISTFHLPAGWNGEVELGVSPESNSKFTTIWQGPTRRGEIRVNRTVPARPGERTHFQLAAVDVAPATQVRKVAYSWSIPALFVDGRRLRPGRQVVSSGRQVSVVARQKPCVGEIDLPAGRVDLGNGIFRWDIQDWVGDRLAVEAAGQQWILERHPPLTMRAWLEPAPSSTSRPDRNRYRLTEEGIDLFFHDCPLLMLEIQGANVPVEKL